MVVGYLFCDVASFYVGRAFIRSVCGLLLLISEANGNGRERTGSGQMTVAWDGIVLGVLVGAVTGCLALLALRWSHDKGNEAFLMAFMGGMVIRLLLVAVASVIILSFTDTHVQSYIVSMLVTYLVFLGLEIFYALAKNAQRKRADMEVVTKAD